ALLTAAQDETELPADAGERQCRNRSVGAVSWVGRDGCRIPVKQEPRDARTRLLELVRIIGDAGARGLVPHPLADRKRAGGRTRGGSRLPIARWADRTSLGAGWRSTGRCLDAIG